MPGVCALLKFTSGLSARSVVAGTPMLLGVLTWAHKQRHALQLMIRQEVSDHFGQRGLCVRANLLQLHYTAQQMRGASPCVPLV